MSCTESCQCEKCMVQGNDLRLTRFSDATLEQFREFFEKRGFEVNVVALPVALRSTKSEVEITIFLDGTIGIEETDGSVYPPTKFTTFHEALIASTEIASTKVLGGWA